MRILKFILVFLVLAFVFAVAFVRAGTLVLVPSTINGTVNSFTNTIGYVNTLPPNFAIISPNITNAPVYITNVVSGVTNVVNVITNAMAGNYQLSLDNTNFFTIDTYRPYSTNQEVDNYSPAASQVTLYYRFQIITTNALPATITK